MFNELFKKIKNHVSKDEHEECFTQAYGSVQEGLSERNYLNTAPYKVEPRKYMKDEELDEYDCTRTK